MKITHFTVKEPRFCGSFSFFTWEQRKVKDVANRYDNLRIPVAANLRVSGRTPYYGANGIQDYVEGFTHEGEFVLVAEDGANDLKNYPVNLVKGRIWVNNHAHVLQTIPKIANNAFLAYSINQSDIESLLVGGGRAKLNAEALMNIEMSFPALSEQEIIGEFLGSIDNLITLHQRKEISGFLTKIDKIIAQNMAFAWEQCKLGTLGSVAMCRRIFKEQTSSKGDIPFYKIGTFGGEADAFITRELFEEYKAKFPYPSDGAVLISASGSIGRTVVYSGENAYFQDSNIVWLAHDDRITDSFLKHLYSVIRWAGIEGSTIKRLYNDNILKTEIFLPPMPEQVKIANYLHSIDNLITLHQCKENGYCFTLSNLSSIHIGSFFNNDWEQREVRNTFKITRGYVLAATKTSNTKSDKTPYPVYSSQTKDNGLMGYYSDYLFDTAITWTTDGANAGTVRFRDGKFYCTNVCGVLLSENGYSNKMVAEALNLVAWKYVSKVGNPKLMNNVMGEIEIVIPSTIEEQNVISQLFEKIDNLITLHQCEFGHIFRIFEQRTKTRKNQNLARDWEQCKFEYWFEERNERSGEGELISVTINSGIKKFSELNRFDSKPEDMSKYKVVRVGDIAYNSMRMWQGASGLSPYNGILSPAYTVISPKNNANSKFFAFLIKKPEMIHLFEINSQGLTKDTWNLKFPAFSQIEAIAPTTTDEQHKIATLLEQLDNLITLHQCKDLQFFIPKKYELSFEICNQKTTTWEQCKLGSIGSTYTGLSGKSKADFGHGKGKFITYMNVFTNPIANLGVVEPIEIDNRQNTVSVGDVFFTTSSETPDEVGMSCVLTENSPNTYLNSFCFGYRPTIKFDNYYLAYMLRSASFRAKITFLAQGISRYNISKNKVMEIEIPIPEFDEQQKIGAYFRNIDNLITLHQRVLINFKEHFYDKRNKQKRITYRLF